MIRLPGRDGHTRGQLELLRERLLEGAARRDAVVGRMLAQHLNRRSALTHIGHGAATRGDV